MATNCPVLRKERQDLKVLYLSGYCDRLFDERNVLWEEDRFGEAVFGEGP